MKEFKHFINGEYMGSNSGKQFENRCPVDNSLIGMVHEAGREEVDAAVQAARQALKGPWGKLTQAQRTEHRVALLVVDDRPLQRVRRGAIPIRQHRALKLDKVERFRSILIPLAERVQHARRLVA